MKEATCALCGKSIKEGAGMTEEIGGELYSFDRQGCAVLFKKFKSVYGSSFLA